MKWFKHDTDASIDAKLQEILLDYGAAGYGLYWYCVELIAKDVTPKNIKFELEHDSRIIARNLNLSIQEVQDMMQKMVSVGLFDITKNNKIACVKLAYRLDDSMRKGRQVDEILTAFYESEEEIKGIPENPESVGKIPNQSGKSLPDIDIDIDIELDKDKELHKEQKNKSKDLISDVFDFWKQTLNHPRARLDDKRKKTIQAAIKLGYTIDELKSAVIGCSKTPHNMGVNERHEVYDDIGLILRDAAHIDKFIKNSGQQPGAPVLLNQENRFNGYRIVGGTA